MQMVESITELIFMWTVCPMAMLETEDVEDDPVAGRKLASLAPAVGSLVRVVLVAGAIARTRRAVAAAVALRTPDAVDRARMAWSCAMMTCLGTPCMQTAIHALCLENLVLLSEMGLASKVLFGGCVVAVATKLCLVVAWIKFIAPFTGRAQPDAHEEAEPIEVENIGREITFDEESMPLWDKSCIVCLEDLVPGQRVKQLECGHVFHITCINAWLQQGRRCPLRCKPGVTHPHSGQADVEAPLSADATAEAAPDDAAADTAAPAADAGVAVERSAVGYGSAATAALVTVAAATEPSAATSTAEAPGTTDFLAETVHGLSSHEGASAEDSPACQSTATVVVV